MSEFGYTTTNDKLRADLQQKFLEIDADFTRISSEVGENASVVKLLVSRVEQLERSNQRLKYAVCMLLTAVIILAFFVFAKLVF